MEHKLFYSKLKSSVEGSALLEIIGSSSSGEDPHRAASMELIFERSIREHKERIVIGAKESKTQPPPADPPVTGKKPVTNKNATIEPAPVKSEKQRPPPFNPTSGLGIWLKAIENYPN